MFQSRPICWSNRRIFRALNATDENVALRETEVPNEARAAPPPYASTA